MIYTERIVKSLKLIVFLPNYQLSLCCSKVQQSPAKPSQNKKFYLNGTEEGRTKLQNIIDAVLHAPDNAIVIRPTTKNNQFRNKVDRHNAEVEQWLEEHPDDDFTEKIDLKDLVRLIDAKHYDASFVANDGTEMHAFKDIWIPQLTENYEKVITRGGKQKLVSLTLYVKLRKIGDNIDVVSLHTGEEN